MVAAYLGETAFWGRSIDDRSLRAQVIEDIRFLTDEPFTFARLAARL